MTVIGIEIDGSCAVNEVKYHCCNSSLIIIDLKDAESLSKCEVTICKHKDSPDKCPHAGKQLLNYLILFNTA
jgi:hypothetical protein